MTEHDDVAGLLPDYALGALDDAELRRVERHLDGCPECRGELASALEVLGSLAAVAPPRRRAREALLLRAAELASAEGAEARTEWPRSVAAGQEAGGAPVRAATGHRRLVPWPRPAAPGWLAVAVLVALLVVPLAGWNLALQRRLDERDAIYRLVSDPAAAHPLADSELPTDAAGVIFADPAGNEAYLVVSGLPPLPPDERYQVWLFTDDGERISAGLFAVEPDGNGRALLRTPAPFVEYVAAAVSAEPRQGSPTPTSPLALGGWIDA